MESSATTVEAQDEWIRIFEVLRPPSRDRIQLIRRGYQIQAGDFGWGSPRAPEDKEGMVHLTGYDEKLRTIWYADLELSEVRYVGPKPTEYPGGKNPFPVKPLQLPFTCGGSATSFYGVGVGGKHDTFGGRIV